MYATIAIKNAKEPTTKHPTSARIPNSTDTTSAGLLGAWIPIFIVLRKLFSFEALKHYEDVFKHFDFVHEFVANLYDFARRIGTIRRNPRKPVCQISQIWGDAEHTFDAFLFKCP